MRRSAISLLASAVLVAIVGACGDESAGDADAGEVVVFAAASLTETFTEIGEQFTAGSGDEVRFNFAASSELVAQIIEGAPADVYASADLDNMARLTDAEGNAAEPVVFARNRAAIVVAPGNPLGISGVDELTDPDLIVVTCAPEVPCGTYATQVFGNAGVEVTADSYEENVKAVVTKVSLGEADAGIVYATDVRAAGDDATGVPIPDDVNVVAEYQMVVTADAPNPDAAQAFVDFVLGEAGQAILTDDGFVSP